MFPKTIKPLRFEEIDQEGWESYKERLSLPNDRALLQFYRQVVFDHWRHFNDVLPDFLIEQHEFEIRHMTVEEVERKVRYFGNEDLGAFWAEQFDLFHKKNQDYMVFQYMKEHLTPPFPPILLDPSALIPRKHWDYGRPIHLVEGTHRVSYLIRMAQREIIPWSSSHEFVYVAPRAPIT